MIRFYWMLRQALLIITVSMGIANVPMYGDNTSNFRPCKDASYKPVVVNVSETQKRDFLAIHNKCRRELKIADLVWDDQLAKSACEWGCELASQAKFYHSGTPNKGENLYWGSSNYAKIYLLAEAAEAWGNEKSLMHGSKFDPHSGAGHYTQMIWRTTQKVGAAVIKRGNDYYIVAHYYPAGNWIGQHVY